MSKRRSEVVRQSCGKALKVRFANREKNREIQTADK